MYCRFYKKYLISGLGDQIGAGLQTDIVPLCGNVNLLWVENGSTILEMYLVTLSLGKLVVVLL